MPLRSAPEPSRPTTANGTAKPPARRKWSVGGFTFAVVAASVVAAAAFGYALAAWLRPVHPGWVALVSALGMFVAAVPLALGLLALARRVERLTASAAPAGAGSSAAAAPAEKATGGAMTRDAFQGLISREWARARRYGTGVALLIVEVDRYAKLITVLGPAAGERVLDALLGQVAQTLRGADAVARHGEGQLAVFLAHADATGALDVAERIRERAEQLEVTVAPRRVRFTVSVGVAHLRPAHLHLLALVDDAAEAVLAASTAGGNCVRAAPIESSQLPSSPRREPPRNDHPARKG